MSSNFQTIDELAAAINKEFGQDVLVRGSATRNDVPRLSTGILAYDLALGGGFAANQWNEIVGDESSGKTAIAYKTIAHNMQQDPDFLAMWVAAEEYVPEYAESFGIDTERLWVVETNEMEAALTFVLKAVENRAVDAVVIDSIPALVPSDEAEKSMEQAGMAVGARLLGKFFRKCAKAQRRLEEEDRQVTLIAINQWRDNIGVMFGDPRTTPGGNAKNYFYFTRMEVRRDDWLKDSTKIEDRVGQVIKMRVFKNKTYRPQQTAQVDFYFADSKGGFHLGDFDTVKDVVNVALALELFEGRYRFQGEKVGKSKDELYDRARQDLGFQQALRDEAMKLLEKDVEDFRNADSSTDQEQEAGEEDG